MSLLDKLKNNDISFSLEFFPPKKDMPISSVQTAIEKLAPYRPAFVSVTYGAGGGNRDRAIEIASFVKEKGLEAIAHLTCVGSDTFTLNGMLDNLEKQDVKNVLAIRGDIPEGMDVSEAFCNYCHASDLISLIKKRGGFIIGAAAYPESHTESASIEEDIKYMRLKEEMGADFFITQLCFNKHAILEFYDLVSKAGIKAPVLTGVMPVLNPGQITRMALLSACSIPAPLSKIISRYGKNAEDFKKAGLDYAIDEIEYLLSNGIGRFHIYTMNKADTAESLILGSGLKEII